MTNEAVKQIIVIRKDLVMRRGKEIAQGAHAALEFLVYGWRETLARGATTPLTVDLSPREILWLTRGAAKICLRVTSEAELLVVHARAQAAGLKSFLILDSGRTEFHGRATYTACAIGPDLTASIDEVTGDLVLY